MRLVSSHQYSLAVIVIELCDFGLLIGHLRLEGLVVGEVEW